MHEQELLDIFATKTYGEDFFNPLALEEIILRQIKEDLYAEHFDVDNFSVDSYQKAFAEIVKNPHKHVAVFNEFDYDLDYISEYNFAPLTPEVKLVAFGRYTHPELNMEMDIAEKAAYQENVQALKQAASVSGHNIDRLCAAEFCQRMGMPAQPEWQAEQDAMSYEPLERSAFHPLTNEDKVLKVYLLLSAEDHVWNKNFPDERCVHRVAKLMDEVPLNEIESEIDLEDFWAAAGKATVRARHDLKDVANPEKVNRAKSYIDKVQQCVYSHKECAYIKEHVNRGIEEVRAKQRNERAISDEERSR